MTNQTEEILPQSHNKLGDDFPFTKLSSLENKTRELLVYTAKKSGLMIPEVEEILKETVNLSTYIASMGHACITPLGLLSIVLMPEDNEFSNVGMTSKLFDKEQIIPFIFNDDLIEFGYEHISSGKMKRALRRMLSPKCATKIKQANETSIFRWYHLKSYREFGE